MQKIDYSSAHDDLLKEIIRQAEIKLQAQLQAAIAADHRALGVAAAMATIVALIMGGTVALFQAPGAPECLAWVGTVVSVTLLVAVVLAVLSARSIGFYFPGSEPSAWEEDVREEHTLKQSLGDMASHYDQMIRNNAREMKRAGHIFNASLIVAGLDLLGGIIYVAQILTPVAAG